MVEENIFCQNGLTMNRAKVARTPIQASEAIPNMIPKKQETKRRFLLLSQTKSLKI